MLKRCAAILLFAGYAVGVQAQLRTIAEDAQRGEIRHVEGMVVEINGSQQRLAPGAQVRDAANRVIVPAAIPAGALGKYVIGNDGMVSRVWILTSQEAAQRDKAK
jgi:hypothetical protein